MVKHLLEYSQATDSNLKYSLLLVLGLLLTEIVRSWSLALTWALNYRTGVRLRGAILTMAFKKILKLKNIKEKSVGEVSKGCLLQGKEDAPSLSAFFPLGACFVLYLPPETSDLCSYRVFSPLFVSRSSSTCAPTTGSGCLRQPPLAAYWLEDPLLPSWA